MRVYLAVIRTFVLVRLKPLPNGDTPLHAHPDPRDDDPEAVADEMLFALDHLRDALRRYRRLMRSR